MDRIRGLVGFLNPARVDALIRLPREGDWLQAVWTCTRSRGGHRADGRLLLAPPVTLSLTHTARRAESATNDG